MTRTRSSAAALPLLLLLVLGALAALAGLPAPARAATTIADVASSLRSDPVYVDAKATAQIDDGLVRTAIQDSGRKIFVAVLPQAAADANGGAAQLTGLIGRGLGDAGAILFTVVGGSGSGLGGVVLTGQSGGSSGLVAGEAQQIASVSRTGDLTGSLVQSVRDADLAAADGVPSGSSGGFSSSGGGAGGGGGGGGGGGAAVLGVLAVLGVGGGGLLYARSRKRRLQVMEGSRADVESLYNRLGADVSNLAPGEDAVARQALADAAERYTATGALLAQSDTPGEFEAARRTVVEGLTAARLVRTRLGLDPGPEIPPPPGQGPQLQATERVQVGDEQYEGSPSYAPGRQHYFGGGYLGGRMVPGGWYGVPFWETLLLGSALSGGLGGGFGGGGFGGGGFGGGGYERGYEEGVDDARDAHRDDSGSDWGGGGGDWGGGGGGGGGGGDWGGGGGGGGDSGGSW